MNTVVELAELAAEVRELHTRSEGSVAMTVGAAAVAIRDRIELGNALNRAKAACGHGSFLAWLEAQCPDLTRCKANRAMRLAKRAPVLNLDSAAGVTEAYTLAGIMPEREERAGGDGPSREERDNYLVHLTRLDRVIKREDPMGWTPEAKAKLRVRLEPLARLYEQLGVSQD